MYWVVPSLSWASPGAGPKVGFIFSAVVTKGFSCPVGAGLGALEVARDVGESVKFELVCSPHSCDAEDPSESGFFSLIGGNFLS